MPYVEVWVDPEGCDGSCGSEREVERLEGIIDEAASLIEKGHIKAALHALGQRGTGETDPADILKKYQKWKKGHLPGFTNFVGDATREQTPTKM